MSEQNSTVSSGQEQPQRKIILQPMPDEKEYYQAVCDLPSGYRDVLTDTYLTIAEVEKIINDELPTYKIGEIKIAKITVIGVM